MLRKVNELCKTEAKENKGSCNLPHGEVNLRERSNDIFDYIVGNEVAILQKEDQ